MEITWGHLALSVFVTLLFHAVGITVFYRLTRSAIKAEVSKQLDTRMATVDASMAVALQAVEQIVDLKNTLANTNALLSKLSEKFS